MLTSIVLILLSVNYFIRIIFPLLYSSMEPLTETEQYLHIIALLLALIVSKMEGYKND